MSTQPPPIIAPLVEGKMDTVITSSVWRLFFQNLQVTVNEVLGKYVFSFAGRTGEVVPQAGDYSVGQVTGAVPVSRTVNGHPLTGPVVVTLADVGGIADAPNDGQIYVRRNGLWEVLVIT
jgi:hypothetical protein